MPKHHAVLDPPPFLTLPELLDEPWATPNPWYTPSEVDKAAKVIDEWIPNAKGLLTSCELPILDEPQPIWEPEPATGILEIGSAFTLSGDLWKPLPSVSGYIGSSYLGIEGLLMTPDAAQEMAKSYLAQVEADGGFFVAPQWQVSEYVSYTGPVSVAPQPGVVNELAELVPALKSFYADTPCGCKHAPLYDAVVHLNDSHSWPREHIAAWLDSLDVDLTFTAQSKGD